MTKIFRARNEGLCGICEYEITRGEDVCFVADSICHADCAEEEGEYERERDLSLGSSY